ARKDNPHHDQHAVGIYAAMAARLYVRYGDLRRASEFLGAEPADGPPIPSQAKLSDQYRKAIEPWIWERADPDPALAARAESAFLIVAEKFIERLTESGSMIEDEVDTLHLMEALRPVRERLYHLSTDEYLEKRRAAKSAEAAQ